MNYKRRRPKTSAPHGGRDKFRRRQPGFDRWHWLNQWPRWHDVVFHSRPRRRRTRRIEVLVLKGRDPDMLIWPLAKKPHIYYW